MTKEGGRSRGDKVDVIIKALFIISLSLSFSLLKRIDDVMVVVIILHQKTERVEYK